MTGKRLIRLTGLTVVRILWVLWGSKRRHMRFFMALLRSQGMKIDGRPRYVSARVWFDGSDLSLITLGDDCVISSNVRILTHDFAVARAVQAAGIPFEVEPRVLRAVRIGKGAFIGTGALLLPGAEVGDHSIIGAGTVVRGRIPPYSLVVGNPGEVIGDTREYGTRMADQLGLLKRGSQ